MEIFLPVFLFSTWLIFFHKLGKNNFTIYIANQLNQTLSYSITDVFGKIIEENNIHSNESLFKQSINASHLTDGCYFTTLKGSNINQTKKIIIQN